MKKEYIIIGSGTAGLNAYRALNKANKDVLIIGNFWGTTCAHVGCMPSKAFIAEAKRSGDYQKSITYARRERDRFVSYVIEGSDSIEHKIHGNADSNEPGRISVNGTQYEYEHLIIATGTSVRPIPESVHGGLTSYFYTSDDIFNKPFDVCPERLLVIGTGVIGLELGNAFEALGTNVDYVNHSDAWGILDDFELKTMHKNAHQVYGNVSNIHAVRESNKSILMEYTLSNGINRREYYDAVLWTAGRVPNTEWLSWDPKHDPHVSFIGDVNGERPILHEAAHQAENILQRINGMYEAEIPFSIVFSRIQQAKIGRKEDVTLWKRRTLNNQGRARLDGINDGGLILGFNSKEECVYAEILNQQAEHLAHFLLMAIINRMTYNTLKNMPYYHPTIYESIKNML